MSCFLGDGWKEASSRSLFCINTEGKTTSLDKPVQGWPNLHTDLQRLISLLYFDLICA